MNQLHLATSKYLELIRHGEFWELLISTLLMLFVGQHLIGNHLHLQKIAFTGGVTAFFAVIVAEFAETGFPLSGSLRGLLIHALLGGMFSFSLGTLVIPVAGICWGHSGGAVLRAYRQSQERRTRAAAARRQERQLQEETLHQQSRQAVIDERRRQQEAEAAEQQLIEQDQHRNDDRRRQIARFECQLLFDQHHAESLDLFPENFLEGHFQRYMSDDVPPELVEQRGQALQAMLQERLRRSGSTETRQFESIAEIISWFDQKREEIRSSFAGSTDPATNHIVETLITQLLRQQDQAIKEFLK